LLENDILYEHQSGFRRNFSTGTALVSLSEIIKSNMDKGELTGMLLIDLRKAFNTVNHQILLNKLKTFGMNASSVSWFSSYLADRGQSVFLNGTFSDQMNVSCGVPQGSILGPLLFLVYMNDMPSSVKCKLFLYADDSALMVSGVIIIQNNLSAELESLSQWLILNELSLHIGKTESILFGSKHRLSKCNELNVMYKGKTIFSSNTVKYLGATLDNNMRGNSMGESVIKMVNMRLKFLYRKQCFVDKDLRKILCNSLVQPHFDYGSCFWYGGVKERTRRML